MIAVGIETGRVVDGISGFVFAHTKYFTVSWGVQHYKVSGGKDGRNVKLVQ
jgi:hypothetical protein